MIEPAFSEHAEARNYRPAIYVDKGETAPSKVAIGNFAGQNIPHAVKGFYSIATIPIEIECVSDKKGESAILADTVWFYMLAGREQVVKTFGLHDMSNPILGRTSPSERDKVEWSTRVTFTIDAHLRWATQPVAPLLQSILIRYREAGNPNPDAYFLEQYIP
jgi:hypothetical protein